MTSKLCLEGCEGKYRPRENTVICSRISKKFAKVFCHVTGGPISARWERELIQSNPSSGTGGSGKRGQRGEGGGHRSDVCFQSIPQGHVEDGAEGKTGGGETKCTVGRDKRRAQPGVHVQGQNYHSFILSFFLFLYLFQWYLK